MRAIFSKQITLFAVTFVLGAPAGYLLAQGPPAQPVAELKDSFNRTTPQRSVRAFLSAVHDDDYNRAAKYLDLDRVRGSDQEKKAASAARVLAGFLNREADFDIARLSNDKEGKQDDGLPADRELIHAGSGLRVEMQRRALGPDNSAVWVFTAETVSQATASVPAKIESAIERNLPAPIVQLSILQTPLWRWLALFLALGVAVSVSGFLSRLLLRILRPVCDRLDPKGTCNTVALFTSPLRVLLSVIVFRVVAAWLPFSALGRFYLDRIVGFFMIVAVAWIISRIIDIFVSRLQLVLTARHSSLSRSVLPLLSKVAKTFVVILAVMVTLTNWGFDMTAALAGVGIGGIAIALAAQKTIENLFGGFAIIADGPVAIGDFCKFGDRVGTVEDIGLRSTRIRTLDRTVVTVPNSEFSAMVLENYSRRDKIWFHPALKLRKDTTSAQLGEIMTVIQEILSKHPKVEIGGFPVRFLGSGEYSLDIEIFAYIVTSDYDQYLRIQQELLMPMLDAISNAGTALALPTQTSIYLGENGSGQAHGYVAATSER